MENVRQSVWLENPTRDVHALPGARTEPIAASPDTVTLRQLFNGRNPFSRFGESKFPLETAEAKKLTGKLVEESGNPNILPPPSSELRGNSSSERANVKPDVTPSEPTDLDKKKPATKSETASETLGDSQAASHIDNNTSDHRFNLGNDGVLDHETTQAAVDTYRAGQKNAPEVEIVHRPDWTHNGYGIRGTIQDGKIILNRAYAGDAGTVTKVLREEHNHLLLSSDEGRRAIRGAVSSRLGDASMSRLAQLYPRQAGESVAEYRPRLMDEFIAKAASENLPAWRDVVERVKTWLASKGMARLTDEETARAIIRALKGNKPGDMAGMASRFSVAPKPKARLMDVRRSNADIAASAANEFASWPEYVKAADGNHILLKNSENGSLGQRVRHLIFDNEVNQLAPQKAEWMPNVPETLKNADFRSHDPISDNRIYVRTYSDGSQHMVVVTPDGVVKDQEPFSAKLITQFKGNRGDDRQVLKLNG